MTETEARHSASARPYDAAAIAAGIRQGVAGLIAGLMVFALLEPSRHVAELMPGEGAETSLYSILLLGVTFGGLVAGLLTIADEVKHGSALRLLFKGSLALAAGAFTGIVAAFAAGFVYQAATMGGALGEPGELVGRGMGWGVFGAGVGLSIGITSWSLARVRRGLLGGLIGGVVGGVLFEMLAQGSENGTISRLVGYTALGLAIGVSTAISDALRKEAWITTVGGLRDGRETRLYRDVNVLGRDELADVPLFGDRTVLRRHALLYLDPLPMIEQISPLALLIVDGEAVKQAALREGSIIEIGHYRLRFNQHGGSALLPGLEPEFGEEAEMDLRTDEHPAPRKRTPADNAAAFEPGSPIVLRVTNGRSAGDFVRLAEGITIGREVDNALTLTDPKISRYHARVERREGAWLLTDLNSTNGTRLNGVRVVRAGLVPGDFIYVGDTVLSVEAPAPLPESQDASPQNAAQATA